MKSFAGMVLALNLAASGLVLAGETQGRDLPSHGRPFFMPDWKRKELQALVREQEWARKDYERVKTAAEKGDGYRAAFLYALGGEARYLDTARTWLVKLAENASTAIGPRLNDVKFFEGGQPGIPGVYYGLDFQPYIAYDWICNGLDEASRKAIEDGLLMDPRFRRRCMDRWWQTPNLVFKPTFMVAIAGLALQDRELIEWGFHRGPGYPGFRWWPGVGGYFVVLEAMLVDGGPWHESTIYAIAHTDLWCMAQMSFYRKLYDGRDWFTHKPPNGGSPKGLMDYYIDTAYPVERAGDGKSLIRVATYGDGATSPGGQDLFLLHPEGRRLNIHQELAACYNASGEPRYAPFVARIPGYKPNLWDARPVPENAAFPSAPSRIWPTFGLAMLRSEESPSYWTSGKAIAVLQVMTQGYSHDHRDGFGIMMHGAGRLLYPDYNAIQYENPAIGWTRNSVAHSTILVDEQDTRNAPPTIRHEFSPEVKFLATSASGVFDGVEQTRALMLTGEYLLDVFHAASKVPHTYDYALHSFGKPCPATPEHFKPSERLARYTAMAGQQSMLTDNAWTLDFAITEGEKQAAAVRVTMAGAPRTLVCHGEWGGNLAELVKERSGGKAELDRLGMLVARRRAVRDTVFVVVHEPYAGDQKPRIRAVAVLAQTPEAIVVRVDADAYSDYGAVSFGPQTDGREHVLIGSDGQGFAFKGYGHLRVLADGAVVGRGGWTALKVEATGGKLTLNGRPADARRVANRLVYGQLPTVVPGKADRAPEPPFEAKASPAVARLAPGGDRTIVLSVTNRLKDAASGRLEFDLPPEVLVEPPRPSFGPLEPGKTAEVGATFRAGAKAAAGAAIVPYRFVYTAGGKEAFTLHLPLKISVGPVLSSAYPPEGRPYYLVQAPRYCAKLDMFHGMPRDLTDDDGAVRLDDSPLFTFGDGEKPLLFEHTPQAFTWPAEAPASLTAQAFDRCRYSMRFAADRVVVGMDKDHTLFQRTHFTVPGKWVSPGGAPAWKKITALNGEEKEGPAQPGAKVKLAAAELEFPGGQWNLAFVFEPAQEVIFEGTGLSFSLGSLTGDRWSVGFCKPGALDAWRKGDAAKASDRPSFVPGKSSQNK